MKHRDKTIAYIRTIAKRRLEGASVRQIAKELGLTETRIYQLIELGDAYHIGGDDAG